MDYNEFRFEKIKELVIPVATMRQCSSSLSLFSISLSSFRI